jgi:hypothetical protein
LEVDHIQRISTKESHVVRLLQGLNDVLSGFNLPNRDQPASELGDGLCDESSAFGLSLSSEHGCLHFFLSYHNVELCSFGILLGDLLLLNGSGKVLGELEVSD